MSEQEKTEAMVKKAHYMDRALETYGEARARVLRDQICTELTPADFTLFVEVAASKGLDPFNREIFAVLRWDRKENRKVMTIQTGIGGYRVIAERTGKLEGQLGPWWCGDDGQWTEVWLRDEPPRAAKVGILRAGYREPVTNVAHFSEYCQTDKSGAPTSMWRKMPAQMIAKCAEALALRRTFPRDLAGIYTSEEMGQASNEEYEVQVEPSRPSPKSRPTPEGQAQSKEKTQEQLKAFFNELLASADDAAFRATLDRFPASIPKTSKEAVGGLVRLIGWMMFPLELGRNLAGQTSETIERAFKGAEVLELDLPRIEDVWWESPHGAGLFAALLASQAKVDTLEDAEEASTSLLSSFDVVASHVWPTYDAENMGLVAVAIAEYVYGELDGVATPTLVFMSEFASVLMEKDTEQWAAMFAELQRILGARTGVSSYFLPGTKQSKSVGAFDDQDPLVEVGDRRPA